MPRRKKALLSVEETSLLVEEAHSGNITSRNKIVERNMGLVYKVARKMRFNPTTMDREDLHQQGVLGLIRAIEKFDPHRGYRFSTYATWWIRQSMQRYIEKVGCLITKPTHIHHKISKITSASNRLQMNTGREPTFQEIANVVGLSPENVTMLKGPASSIPISINSPISEGSTIEDLLSVEGFEEDSQLKLYIAEFLKPKEEGGLLTEKERIIIHEVFWNGRTPRELKEDTRLLEGKDSISRQYISNALNRALTKLRKNMLKSSGG